MRVAGETDRMQKKTTLRGVSKPLRLSGPVMPICTSARSRPGTTRTSRSSNDHQTAS